MTIHLFNDAKHVAVLQTRLRLPLLKSPRRSQDGRLGSTLAGPLALKQRFSAENELEAWAIVKFLCGGYGRRWRGFAVVAVQPFQEPH
ncbi:hypothetical protein TcasGA2_TC004813 [Tribolium castaneum]|uniref:Uncharacterized protein n=1 Tax=Tribolium castaneum TaxID=7070 RepID=D6WB68_TRICA|nr:hypothetical protein TcasGA2_TC004813 [Tribolium castaneum]